MSRWAVLVVSPQRITPVELPTTRPLVVGRGRAAGLELSDPTVDERHLTLRVVNERPLLDPLGGTSGVLVNDVPCEAPMALGPGDEIALGASRLVVMPWRESAEARLRLCSEDELTARLGEEVPRALGAGRSLALVLISTAGLNVPARQALARRVVEAVRSAGAVATWGEVADDLLGGLIPELPPEALDGVLKALPEVAGPRARTVSAVAGAHGRTGEALLEWAFCQLLGLPLVPDDATVADPVMLRLHGLADELSRRGGLTVIGGPPGSGRSTLARAVARARGRPIVEFEGASRASSGRGHDTVLVRDEELEPAGLEVLQELARERRRLVVLVTATLARVSSMASQLVELPRLADRPTDVEALAEAFLRETRAALSRPRLSLGADARELLLRYPWPGEVPELRTVIMRSARASVRDELGTDALPQRLASPQHASNLRGALAAAERDLLLEALARTRWNVTAAASRLGLPRRTVVYRMARLGLRRPARHR